MRYAQQSKLMLNQEEDGKHVFTDLERDFIHAFGSSLSFYILFV